MFQWVFSEVRVYVYLYLSSFGSLSSCRLEIHLNISSNRSDHSEGNHHRERCGKVERGEFNAYTQGVTGHNYFSFFFLIVKFTTKNYPHIKAKSYLNIML